MSVRMWVPLLAPLSGLRIWHCPELQLDSDLVLPWPWCRPAAAASLRPLAWEPPYATETAIKLKKNNNFFESRLAPYVTLSFRFSSGYFSYIL